MIRQNSYPSTVSPRNAHHSTTTTTLYIIKLVLLLCCAIVVGFVIWTLPQQSFLQLPYLPALRSRQPPTTSTLITETKCFHHAPFVSNKTAHLISQNTTASTFINLPFANCGSLSRNWTHVPLQSELARRIAAHQRNCSLRAETFYVDNLYGLGSHLYLWSQAVCNAMDERANARVLTRNPIWLWMDQEYCAGVGDINTNPLQCYFPKVEAACNNSNDNAHTTKLPVNTIVPVPIANTSDPRNVKHRCRRMQTDPLYLTEFRAAAMEYLFQSVSPLVVREAQRQLGLLFPNGKAPENLITVHMRWGDKFWEMDLAPAAEYIAAIHTLLNTSSTNANATNAEPVAIYLSTEDPRAAAAFRNATPPNWTVYVDRTIHELDTYRPAKGNRASWTTRNTRGRAGLVALGSLLVALEANLFVLTTKSNWSRLLNELRKNVIHPRCGNCTRMIDLRPGEW